MHSSPLPAVLALLAVLLPQSQAHGTHAASKNNKDNAHPTTNKDAAAAKEGGSTSWAERHLLSEHHIANYDAGAFFALHDFDEDGHLSRDELLRTYGAALPSDHYDQDHIWHTVRDMLDTNGDGRISLQEWMEWSRKGGQLPDFGTGVGHHGDDESEYEIHHFEEFHSNDNPDGSDMVIHPEDLEHVSRRSGLERG